MAFQAKTSILPGPIRCKPSDRELVNQAAESCDQKVSDWMRTVVVAAARRQMAKRVAK